MIGPINLVLVSIMAYNYLAAADLEAHSRCIGGYKYHYEVSDGFCFLEVPKKDFDDKVWTEWKGATEVMYKLDLKQAEVLCGYMDAHVLALDPGGEKKGVGLDGVKKLIDKMSGKYFLLDCYSKTLANGDLWLDCESGERTDEEVEKRAIILYNKTDGDIHYKTYDDYFIAPHKDAMRLICKENEQKEIKSMQVTTTMPTTTMPISTAQTSMKNAVVAIVCILFVIFREA